LPCCATVAWDEVWPLTRVGEKRQALTAEVKTYKKVVKTILI
jgi:hypothetical protein